MLTDTCNEQVRVLCLLIYTYLEEKLDDVIEKAISFFIGQGILNLIYRERGREGGREKGGWDNSHDILLSKTGWDTSNTLYHWSRFMISVWTQPHVNKAHIMWKFGLFQRRPTTKLLLYIRYCRFFFRSTVYNIHDYWKLTNGDSSPDDLLDVKERTKGVEELEHHHCTTKLLMGNNTADWSGLWQGLWAMSEEREREREREREGREREEEIEW